MSNQHNHQFKNPLPNNSSSSNKYLHKTINFLVNQIHQVSNNLDYKNPAYNNKTIALLKALLKKNNNPSNYSNNIITKCNNKNNKVQFSSNYFNSRNYYNKNKIIK